MKKWTGKILAAALSALSLLGIMPVPAQAQGMTAQQLQRKFPNGAYWNHVVQEGHGIIWQGGGYLYDQGDCNNPDGYTWHQCTNHYMLEFFPQEVGFYDCNTYGSIQCRGFARKLSVDAYGIVFTKWDWEYMKTEGIKPGDCIWYYTTDESIVGHQAMIIDVEGTKLCLGECNWCSDCYISWGRWFDLDDVAKWTIYSAPYELPGAGEENIIKEKKGDVDGDGKRTLEDAQLTLGNALRIKNLGETETWAADLDGDGTVSLADAQFSLKLALKIESIWDDAAKEENELQEEWEQMKEFDKIFFDGIPEEERQAYWDEHYEEYYEQWDAYWAEYLKNKGH